MWSLWVLPLADVSTSTSVASQGWNVCCYWDQDQTGQKPHLELPDSCLLLPEDRLPEKGAQSEACTQKGYNRDPGLILCVAYPNRPEASSPLTSG